MPVPGTFQFGYEHRLYIGANVLSDRPSTMGGNGTGTHFNTAAQWTSAYDTIRDLDVGGSENTVDITTRDEARKGFTVEPVVSQTGQITFQIRWLPSQQADLSDADANFVKLLKAWRGQDSVALMELDQERENEGAQGFVGNFNISFNWNKPVQGVVVVDVNARLVSYPDWIVCQSYSSPNSTFEIIENV